MSPSHRVTLACAAVVSVLATCCVPSSYHPKPPVPVDDLKSKTVALVSSSDDPTNGGVQAYCSGVWVSKHTILTANHCVDDEKLGATVEYVTVRDVFVPGSMMPRGTVGVRGTTLYAVDSDHDLALLRDDTPPDHAWSKVVTQPAVAAPVQALGHSLGLWWSYSAGTIAAVRYVDLDMPARMLWVQTTTPVSPGNSGGALFDLDGDVLGVCHGSYTKGQMLNFFVHPSYVRAFLDAQGAML